MPAPKSVTTLRRHYRDRLAEPQDGALRAELLESNDRSVIITVAAHLDGVAEFAIARKLRPLDEFGFEEAFRPDGPMGSFSAKIDLLYLMQIIEAPTKRQLHDIRELRNACAHSRLPVSFGDPIYGNVAKRVIHPTGLFKLKEDSGEDLRAAFLAECLLIHSTVLHGQEEAIRMTRESYARLGRESPI